MTRRLARILAMLVEHDALHLETSLYIALQACERLNLPSGFSIPDFASLARGWNETVRFEGEKRMSKLNFEAQEVTLGHEDNDSDLEAYDEKHELGWDPEHPMRTMQVEAFTIDALPITNLDYLLFLVSLSPSRPELFPSSWSAMNGDSLKKGEIGIKTLYGNVPFEIGQHWATCASALQLNAFALAQNARLPTEVELRVYFAQNPTDTGEANIGFKNFHQIIPTLPTMQRDGKLGKGGNGGVWEWTSTLLEAHPGFSTSLVYPGYSSDFHDGQHQIILGGSYLTFPRIAGRKSHVNWYQAGYPYVVAGARLVRS